MTTLTMQPEEAAVAYQVEAGRAHPLGAIPDASGVNFSVYADRATSVELLLFNDHDDTEPFMTITLDPGIHKTFHFWHVYVRGLKSGTHYVYRVDGLQDAQNFGDRYNSNKALIDPYARGNTDTLWNRADACGPQDNLATSMRSVVIDTAGYNWEGDRPINRPMSETVIYEMHVGGFTRSPTSECQFPGTYAGVIEKIPYLKELGITAVELLPVFDFDQKGSRRTVDGKTLSNYWGYDPHSFFAPENSYCVNPEVGKHINEFRNMVKALHKASISVILDVVFNHTTEGDQRGPTLNFRGFANSSYYMLSSLDRQYYMNFSGCGNTFNGNHPITEKLIVEALEYWVTEMHVDGFRFDEAVILCRDQNGAPMTTPPVIWQIELSEILADTNVIAEAWDAAGLYEVGYFPGYRWGEWNGRFRDTMRRFVKGDQGYSEGKTIVAKVADVIAGSADLFESSGELPINSVNFITAHDGFTLNDLVSYNNKHNEANGEGNNDGIDDNMSWNCGAEGETDNPGIETLRNRQVKNFAALLLLSQGVPMFVAGDEVRRTQRGNNNAYCQDNEINWFDWSLVEKRRDIFRFFSHMIAFRRDHPALHRSRFFTGEVNRRGLRDMDWHGCRLYSPGWNDPSSRALAFTLGSFEAAGVPQDVDIHVILNMEWEDLDFDLPPVEGRQWHRLVDTALPSPDDIVTPDETVMIDGNMYRAQKHSVIVLISR